VSDRRPIGGIRLGGRRLTVLREILRRVPFESTIYLGDNARTYGVRTDDEVSGSASRRSTPSWRDVKALVVACIRRHRLPWAISGARYDLLCWAWSDPARRRPPWRHATGASGSSPPRPRFARAPTSTPSRTRTRPSRYTEHATPSLVPLVEAGRLTGPECRGTGCRCAPARRAQRRRRVHLPVAAVGADRHAAPGLHPVPLLVGELREIVGDSVAIVDSATAPRHRSRSCCR